jgi:hypothetical protein
MQIIPIQELLKKKEILINKINYLKVLFFIIKAFLL